MLKLLSEDEYLRPYEHQLNQRHQWYSNTLEHINKNYGSLDKYSQGYLFYGFNEDEKSENILFREWLPNALAVSLVGDFNNWEVGKTALHSIENGNWEVSIPKDILISGSKVKLAIYTSDDNLIYKIPAYIRYVVQNEDMSYDGVYLEPTHFHWKDEAFHLPKDFRPIIYESHIGMATEEHKVGSYEEFTNRILPYIKELGYNAIQLMAIQEHPYYGSFGYQVANFFAPSSRFGMPDDLKNLINSAHQLGIAVILDVVHSHSVKNEIEGLSNIDGTDIYFNGTHPDWDSKLFDYGKEEVRRFLLSNIKYWMEEFHFDGFRFDGVTSMLYNHFGHISFDNYSKYFENTNNDAIIYLQLANTLIGEQNKEKISICEDMSGMPGACVPVQEGGLGFDYRLAMGIPDYWLDLLENTSDEEWNVSEMYWRLSNRRLGEKNIAYVESHDQALVGDKTTAFWLMDKEMYTHMSVETESPIIDRGIALHKLIRFITISLGGEGYMAFIGNEFGHPEWVDFPREGNGYSYHYARRQWSLMQDQNLRYRHLYNFDKDMIHFAKKHKILEPVFVDKIYENNDQKIMIFQKQGLVFVFNFGQESFPDFQFWVPITGNYSIAFNSDQKEYGGFERVDTSLSYPSKENQISVYIPSRTAFVLKPEK